LSVGEKVVLKKLGNEGTIISLDEEQAEIQVGPLHMRVPLEEIRRKQEAAEGEPQAVRFTGTGTTSEKHKPGKVVGEPSSSDHRRSSLLSSSPGIELDLRGQRAEDALEMLDRYLERAYMTGLPFVRIIHGKGTGKLRQEVRAALKGHPHVSSYEEGGDKEGGAGVTVAKLATE
jgi:DNA mismatch repair protein MutS2